MSYIITKLDEINKVFDLELYVTNKNLEGFIKDPNSIYIDNLNECSLNFDDFSKIIIHNFNQKNWEEYLSVCSRNISHLELFKCPSISDLSSLSSFVNLESVVIYWNKKLRKIWNINDKLKHLRINECNSIKDFSSLRESYIEELILTSSGEDLTAKKAKLNLDNENNILEMKKLKSLILLVNEATYSTTFLIGVSKLKNLEKLVFLDDAYTFEEFAWLKSKNSNLKDLVGVEQFFDCFTVIGKRKPRSLSITDIEKINKYNKRFIELIEIYQTTDEVPFNQQQRNDSY